MKLHQLELPSELDDESLSGIDFSSENFIFHLMSAAKVYVQFFRGLPLRVRVRDQRGEHICEMPERFKQALARGVAPGTPIQRESVWSFYGYRHGSLKEAAEVVVAELDMAIDDEQLAEWIENSTSDREICLLHSAYSISFFGGAPGCSYLA